MFYELSPTGGRKLRKRKQLKDRKSAAAAVAEIISAVRLFKICRDKGNATLPVRRSGERINPLSGKCTWNILI